jgi:plasmid stabilization system protein ParE
VNLFIQESAEQDILRQVEWYAEQGLPDIALRFHAAVIDAVDALVAMPGAGVPKATSNPNLAGLRSWQVAGFEEFRLYYLVHPELLTILRVLHGKRDIGRLLAGQEREEP